MKRKNILKISIVPLIVLTVLAVGNVQPPQGKGKDDKAQGQSGSKGKDDAHAGNDQSRGNAGAQGNNQGKGNKQQDRGNNAGQGQQNDHPGQGKGNSNKGQADNNPGQGKGNNQGRGNANDNQSQGKGKNDQDRGANNQGNQGRENAGGGNNAGRGKMYRSNGNSVTMNGKRDAEINWGFDDFVNRRRPGQKKVTICHHPGGINSEYPVTISISENAVQAHLNHGDQLGNCSVNYGDRWSSNYLESRQNVYTVYEQAWETMSFGEALLNYAVQRLLGVRTDLDRNRIYYTTPEIQRREALIYELQNNVDALENQLGYTRQRLDSDVNIIIQL